MWKWYLKIYVDKKESRYVGTCQSHDFGLVASIFEAHKCKPIWYFKVENSKLQKQLFLDHRFWIANSFSMTFTYGKIRV